MPRSRSTAVIIAPRGPYCSANGRSRGAWPRPHSQTFVAGRLPAFCRADVHRMVAKHADASSHQLAQHVAARAARIVFEHRLIGDVVRRPGSRVVRERRRQLRPAPEQQIAITHARHELDRTAILRIARDLLLRRRQQLGRLPRC